MEQTKTTKKPGLFEKRIHEIDFVRGLLIILVLMDHIFNNFKTFGASWWGTDSAGYIFFNWYWTGSAPGLYLPLRHFIQPMALMAFCFVSGISCAFSKNNWKRAIETLFVWFLLFLGGNIIQLISDINGLGISTRMDFDIIGVLGVSMLLYCCVQHRSWRIMVAVILATLLFYFYFMPGIKEHLIKVVGEFTATKAGHSMTLPKVYAPLLWYPWSPDYLGAWPADGFVPQADYVSLFPYVSFFFAGALFSMKFYMKDKKSLVKRFEFERPVCFLGRHTLVIYLSHILVILGIFYGIDAIVKLF